MLCVLTNTFKAMSNAMSNAMSGAMPNGGGAGTFVRVTANYVDEVVPHAEARPLLLRDEARKAVVHRRNEMPKIET